MTIRFTKVDAGYAVGLIAGAFIHSMSWWAVILVGLGCGTILAIIEREMK